MQYCGINPGYGSEEVITIPSSLSLSPTDVPPTESTIFPGICPQDTNEEHHQSYTWLPFKGHCYLFVTDEIEWADAASSCVRHGKRHF